MKKTLLRKVFAAGCGLGLSAALPLTGLALDITAPVERQVVPLLTERQRAYVQTPRDVRETYFADNRQKCAELKCIRSKPNPVRIAWAGSGENPVTVTIRRLPSGELIHSFSGRTNVLDVANLEIAREYACEVACGGEKAVRRFRTEDLAPRFMDVPNINNMRDLGGRIGLGGRRVKQGLIYRSAGWNSNARWKTKKTKGPDGKWKNAVDESVPPVAGTNRLTEAGRAYALKTLGIRSDIDLRKDSECWGMTGSPIGPGVTWFHYSYLGYSVTDRAAGREAFAKVFRVMLDEKNYPLVFHCIGGADRTGTVAFILNALLGCSEEELYLDWEVTGFTGGIVDAQHRGWFKGLVRTIGKHPGATWAEKAADYVRGCGFTDADIAKFRDMMLEETSSPDAGGAAPPVAGTNAPARIVKIRSIAHRGLYSPTVPQNSIAAFKAAYAAGAKQIETDFHWTADGQLLCVHGRSEIKNLSGVTCENIGKLTAADVAAIDIGKSAKTPEPVRMPFVEDVMAIVPKDAIVQCEIKRYGGNGYADRFDAARRAAGLSETNILVTSFNADWIAHFKKRYPKYQTGWLECKVSKRGFDLQKSIDTAKSAGCEIFCPSAKRAVKSGFGPAEADRVRAAGLEVRLFGVNSRGLLEYAVRIGATAFTTDRWRKSFEWAETIPNLELTP